MNAVEIEEAEYRHFHRSYPFTGTTERMSERGSSNTYEVVGELFRGIVRPTGMLRVYLTSEKLPAHHGY